MVKYEPHIDYYEILQVHPSAHQEVIKRAYRTIMGLLQAHPDLGGNPDDAIRVNQAYQVLSDPEARKAYDTARREHLSARKRSSAMTAPPPSHTAGATTGAAPRPRQTPTPRPTTASAGTRATTATAAPTAPAESLMVQILYCPHCGARNRLPRTANLRRAMCGKCRGLLQAPVRETPTFQLSAADLKLPAALTTQLLAHGELRLQRTHMPADHRLYCRRCHHEWQEPATEQLPAICPNCLSARWGDFRIFRCRHCQHDFCTDDLSSWPYWLFPDCPNCHSAHWHVDSERHPLRWIFNQLNKLGS